MREHLDVLHGAGTKDLDKSAADIPPQCEEEHVDYKDPKDDHDPQLEAGTRDLDKSVADATSQLKEEHADYKDPKDDHHPQLEAGIKDLDKSVPMLLPSSRRSMLITRTSRMTMLKQASTTLTSQLLKPLPSVRRRASSATRAANLPKLVTVTAFWIEPWLRLTVNRLS